MHRRLTDAGLVFIGRHPHALDLAAASRRARAAPTARSAGSRSSIRGGEALEGIEKFERLEVLYWLHLSRRDLVKPEPGQ